MVEDQIADGTAFCRCTEHDPGASSEYDLYKRECHTGHYRCPNQGECWGCGTATFMIGGNICTRACKFCNVTTGHPAPLDPQEPEHVARSIRLLGLKHAVITSVDRDDVEDLGASHWVKVIRAIRKENPEMVLIASPNNPTGNSLTSEELDQILSFISPDLK